MQTEISSTLRHRPAEVVEILPRARNLNDFAGLMCPTGAEERMARWGIERVWCDDRVAFGGAPVWVSPGDDLVASGELVLDNLDELQMLLNLPQATPGEVVLALYRQYGRRGIDRLLGMFALAIWDRKTERLCLWRDGPGARTLYHARQGESWWFGSRLRTVHTAPGVSGDISPLAVRRYLSFSYVPGSITMWQDINELLPGHVLELPAGDSGSFWEPEERIASREHGSAQAQQLRTLLEDTVRRMLPPSGPLVVFLSGGIDSSAVTAIAVRQMAIAGQQMTEPVHTFALHFGAQHLNELEFSALVAEHCGTEHQVIEMTAAKMYSYLPETMAALDNPIGDPLTVPNFLMGRSAVGIAPIVFNGEGGDQCFGAPRTPG